jgi:4-diphosphocytidyl-2C-methyl-D-erythritol kinase
MALLAKKLAQEPPVEAQAHVAPVQGELQELAVYNRIDDGLRASSEKSSRRAGMLSSPWAWRTAWNKVGNSALLKDPPSNKTLETLHPSAPHDGGSGTGACLAQLHDDNQQAAELRRRLSHETRRTASSKV